MVWYYVYLEDENEDSYTIQSEGGNGYLTFPNGYITPNISGIGTDTLEASFSLTQVNNPSSLTISEVGTYDWIDSEDSGEYYYDVAGPDATEPVDDGNGGSNGDSDSSGEISDDILDKLWAGSLLCIGLTIIVPVIIIILIVFLILKVIKGWDDKEQRTPQQYQQQQYQQPPQEQQREQTPAPPEDQGESKDTPPPPEEQDDSEDLPPPPPEED